MLTRFSFVGKWILRFENIRQHQQQKTCEWRWYELMKLFELIAQRWTIWIRADGSICCYRIKYMVSGYFGASGLDNLIFWIPFFKQVINVEGFDVRFFFRKSFYVDGCWVTMMAGVLLVFRQIHKANWNGENEKHIVYKSIW